MGNYVLSMYDIRGIQNYIFKSPKMKETIGASKIVENIFHDALNDAEKKFNDLKFDLNWESKIDIDFVADSADVQVLYIGGGNAYVLYKNIEDYKKVTKHMSIYVLKNTYSLQLCSACVNKTDKYLDDIKNLRENMTLTKNEMHNTKPLGAIPFMKTDVKTGLPIGWMTNYTAEDERTIETRLKEQARDKSKEKDSFTEKILDNYGTEKTVDSTIAVVHIDGNNMATRIKKIMENHKDYNDAIKTMRKMSKSINNSYKSTFEEIKNYYDDIRKKEEKNHYYIMKLVVAGDDITYICNGKIALESVKMFAEKISNLSMYGDNDEYKFSICAGVAFMNSHFPFYIGYQVAESCCDNAKTFAKAINETKIGNYVDYQICSSVQSLNIDDIREREYIAADGKSLLGRPYCINVSGDENTKNIEHDLNTLIERIKEINKDGGLPRSFAKELRNTYALGEEEMNRLCAFLDSRDPKEGPENEYPDWIYKPFGDGQQYASYYDVLELMDLVEFREEKNNG